MLVLQLAGDGPPCGRTMNAVASASGPYSMDLRIWEADEVVGKGAVECVAPEDALSNLPALWSGTVSVHGRCWLAEGPIFALRLTPCGQYRQSEEGRAHLGCDAAKHGAQHEFEP